MNAPLFRPPAEAFSAILQIDRGCPWNRCAFCGMYTDVPFTRRSRADIRLLVAAEAARDPAARRMFLADGDVMHRSAADLLFILDVIREHFPRARRVSTYANGHSIMAKTDAQLRQLKSCGLHTLYMGLESGDPWTLRRSGKRETAEVMVEAGRRAQACGLRLSVMLLLGLGGRERSAAHAEATAAALNRMQPRLLSALRLVPVPGTVLQQWVAAGTFTELTEYETVAELRRLITDLALDGTVFRANHVSNVVPLEGRLPRDKERLLRELDATLAGGALDRSSPGRRPLYL